MENQFQNIEKNSISNKNTDTNINRSKRPFVYTILGLIALGFVGFLIGTKLDATNYQAKIIDPIITPSITISSSIDGENFFLDELTIDEAQEIQLKWVTLGTIEKNAIISVYR